MLTRCGNGENLQIVYEHRDQQTRFKASSDEETDFLPLPRGPLRELGTKEKIVQSVLRISQPRLHVFLTACPDAILRIDLWLSESTLLHDRENIRR